MAQRQKLGGAKDAVDDLVMLDTVKDDEIIKNLRNRYASDQIYTNIGPVLVAINPFKMIPRLFTEAKIREYRGKKFYEMPPHVYALADDAYRKMLGFHENQCIIISGESGSGKTETSKLIMQYISSVSGKSAEVQRVKDRMLSSNPLLEAFGNAKTVNNNNSSRFGKYMEILFDYGGDPVGGRVTNYLLEKSRVVGPAQNERNFHVFYQITMGASDAEREQYCLYGPEAYWYLSQSQCLTVDGIDDIKDFKEMTDAMVVMGLTEQDRAEVFRVISTILWLGNLQFEENHNEESKVSDPQVLEICAALLQVQGAALEKSICTRMIQTGAGARTENFCKPLPAKQASFSRDTLAKALYSRMFDWLVARVNDSIKKPDFKGVMIGVLDIYGFEIFQFNSFEQLCINFVNERLQQIFIELTLKAEQDEYRSEGIPWQEVEYYNNKPLCDLIENTPGLLSIMDDCCNTAKTDQMFVQDVGRYFTGNQAIFCGSNDFSIRHYAGDVRYEAEGFLQKNKDTLFDDLIQVIQSSPCAFVRDHGWSDIQVSTGQKKRPVTVGFAFKQQVAALMAALKACEPHYIRCIKPNMQKTPNNFNDANIKRQVQYLGLLENIRVRRAGYATRHPYATFVKRYKLLSRDVLAKRVRGDERVLCQAILSGIGFREGQEYAMGRTKVFIRHATAVFHLEDMIERKMNEAVIVIQKAYRKYKKKRYYLEMRAKAYDVVNGRKERRRGSVAMDYRGDYLNFTYNNLVGGLLQATGKREKVVFADRAKNIILRGKRSFFERIASAFKTEDQFEHRFLLLSDEALYSLTFLQDPQTNKTKVELYFRIPYNQIQSVTVSPYQDNFVIIHFAASAGKTDILASVRHKTELLGLLVHNFKLKTNGQLNVQFLQTDSISVGDNKLVVVTWVKDELAPEEKLMPVKHNVEIHICSGVPPSQVPAPFRPAEIDSSVPARPSLRALYDFKGNGVDELSFKKDDIIFVIAEEDGGWYNGELNGQKGFVPSNYVERIQRQAVAKPQAAAKPPPPAAALPVKCDWQELTTDDGMVYYWNNVSGESRWEKPPEMVAFERTHKPSISKPTVVAPQVQKCSAPGCSNDVFGGKDVCITHAKREEKQPVAVAQPQVKVQAAVIRPQIQQAAPVAAVANKPPAPATPAPSRTGFGTVQPRGPAAAAAVAQARPAMPAAAGARPEMKMVMPAAAAQPRPSPTAAQTPVSPRSAAVAAARPAQAAQPQPGGFRLPVANQQPAAAAAVARPSPVAAATPARPAQAFKPPVPAAQPKKSAWTAQYDPASGATYYYNTETGASQWEKPADM